MCILLNRKFNAYLINIQAPIELYKENGTCFDGELILLEDSNLVYYIFDCISICGMNVKTQKFSHRIHHIEHLLKSVLLDCFFKIVLKTFWDKTQIKELFESMKLTNRKTDGIIFIPENTEIKTARQLDLFKWKPTEDNTIDFHIKRVDDTIDEFTFYIYCVESKKLEPVQTVYIKDPFKLQIIQSGIKEPLFKNKLKDIDGNSTDLLKLYNSFNKFTQENITNEFNIFECKYDSNLWDVVKSRSDKHHPNDSITYQNTVINIQENITKNEIINFLN
jgi:mRNA guanylyltransferase